MRNNTTAKPATLTYIIDKELNELARRSGLSLDDLLLSPAEAAMFLRLKLPTLAKYRVTGEGPKFYRIGGKAVRYRLSDLKIWAMSKFYTSTSKRS